MIIQEEKMVPLVMRTLEYRETEPNIFYDLSYAAAQHGCSLEALLNCLELLRRKPGQLFIDGKKFHFVTEHDLTAVRKFLRNNDITIIS